MSHTEPEVRLAGLFLSVYSTTITKPITGGVFKSLRQNLIHFHTDTDANFRRELLGYTQKLFDRLRGSTATLVKTKAKPTTAMQIRMPFPRECFGRLRTPQPFTSKDPLLEALQFLVWYLRFLECELRTDASYQRRITALRALIIVLKSGLDPRVPHHLLSKSAQGQLNWAHELRIPNRKLIRTLLDLILDPFDDIRDASVSVLQLCLNSMPDNERNTILSALPRFITRAEAAMLRTGRADQADGVARAYSLLFSSCTLKPGAISERHTSDPTSRVGLFSRLSEQLSLTLQVAHKNLSEAVNGRPVHGTFAAIRFDARTSVFVTTLTLP